MNLAEFRSNARAILSQGMRFASLWAAADLVSFSDGDDETCRVHGAIHSG
jgi:hypothetical protein